MKIGQAKANDDCHLLDRILSIWFFRYIFYYLFLKK